MEYIDNDWNDPDIEDIWGDTQECDISLANTTGLVQLSKQDIIALAKHFNLTEEDLKNED